jgi:Fur family transcriptional regulator, zinc uptake regulator
MNFDQAIQSLKASGQKLTPQRMEVLRILMDAKKPLSAQEVFATIRQAQPSISIDTVYRNLTMLTDSGLVHQTNLQNRDVSKFEFQGDEHRHYAICLACHRNILLDLCPLEATLNSQALKQKFSVVKHAFEIYGYCADCRPDVPANA